MNKIITAITIGVAVTMASCGKSEAPQEVSSLPVRYAVIDLAGIATAEALTARCEEEEALFRAHFAELEAFDGTPATDGYYQSLDSLFSSLGTLGSTASSLGGVHPDADLRDAGDACSQLLTKVTTDMNLSRPLYDAVSRIDPGNVDDATKYSIEKLLLGFRLSGVDKDDATRERIRELNDQIVAIGQEWDRNIRDDVRYMELDSVEELAGLPEDYIAAHQPNDAGKIVISTQYPDVFPFFEYADNDARLGQC